MHPEQPAKLPREHEKARALADLKVEINELLWRSLPGETTMEEAEEIATRWFLDVERAWGGL